jgi:hypothetical protein
MEAVPEQSEHHHPKAVLPDPVPAMPTQGKQQMPESTNCLSHGSLATIFDDSLCTSATVRMGRSFEKTRGAFAIDRKCADIMESGGPKST